MSLLSYEFIYMLYNMNIWSFAHSFRFIYDSVCASYTLLLGHFWIGDIRITVSLIVFKFSVLI